LNLVFDTNNLTELTLDEMLCVDGGGWVAVVCGASGAFSGAIVGGIAGAKVGVFVGVPTGGVGFVACVVVGAVVGGGAGGIASYSAAKSNGW